MLRRAVLKYKKAKAAVINKNTLFRISLVRFGCLPKNGPAIAGLFFTAKLLFLLSGAESSTDSVWPHSQPILVRISYLINGNRSVVLCKGFANPSKCGWIASIMKK